MDKIEWVEVARRGKSHSVLIIDQVCESYARGLLEPTIDSDFHVQHYRQLAGARWMAREDVEGYKEALQRGVEEPPWLEKKARDRDEIVEDLKKFASEIEARNLPLEQREKLIRNFMELCVQLWATAYHYIVLNMFYPDVLTARVAQRESNVQRQNEYLKTLFDLPAPTDTRREKESLLRIALAASGKGNWRRDEKIQQMVALHLQEFAHLGWHYWWGGPFTSEHIASRMEVLLSRNLRQEVQIAGQAEHIEQRTQEVFNKLNFTQQEKEMVAALRAWARTANYADEVYSRCVHILAPCVKQVCKGWGISWNQFASMRVAEIYKAFENGFDENLSPVLASRAQEHAIILDNPRVTVLHGSELKEYKNRELQAEEAMHHLRELQGQSVCPGLVEGKAKLVLSLEDADSLKPGEILIANSTFPAYVPAMERASAIVTDEGGLLCHAAIVSRELNKPCIVGTRIATKVFRNGDKVAVDATSGTIKKI